MSYIKMKTIRVLELIDDYYKTVESVWDKYEEFAISRYIEHHSKNWFAPKQYTKEEAKEELSIVRDYRWWHEHIYTLKCLSKLALENKVDTVNVDSTDAQVLRSHKTMTFHIPSWVDEGFSTIGRN